MLPSGSNTLAEDEARAWNRAAAGCPAVGKGVARLDRPARKHPSAAAPSGSTASLRGLELRLSCLQRCSKRHRIDCRKAMEGCSCWHLLAAGGAAHLAPARGGAPAAVAPPAATLPAGTATQCCAEANSAVTACFVGHCGYPHGGGAPLVPSASGLISGMHVYEPLQLGCAFTAVAITHQPLHQREALGRGPSPRKLRGDQSGEVQLPRGCLAGYLHGLCKCCLRGAQRPKRSPRPQVRTLASLP